MRKDVDVDDGEDEQNENERHFTRANLLGDQWPADEKVPVAADQNGEIGAAEQEHGEQGRGDRCHASVELFVAIREQSVPIDAVGVM